MVAVTHIEQADRILDRHGGGAMSEDTALRTLTLATGLDEADAAFLLIDRWDTRHGWGPDDGSRS